MTTQELLKIAAQRVEKDMQRLQRMVLMNGLADERDRAEYEGLKTLSDAFLERANELDRGEAR